MKKILIALLLVNAVLLSGCNSSITAISLKGKNGNKKAIPYYPPQPYLLITKDYSHPATKVKKTEESAAGNTKKQAGEVPKEPKEEKSTTTITTEPVSITVNGFTYKIIYLPNLKEKYGLVYNAGSGESDLTFTLKDGWMFTGLNLKSDTQIDETITAMGSLVGSVAKAVAPIKTMDISVQEQKLKPAIWLYKMTLKDKGQKIIFEPVELDGLTDYKGTAG